MTQLLLKYRSCSFCLFMSSFDVSLLDPLATDCASFIFWVPDLHISIRMFHEHLKLSLSETGFLFPLHSLKCTSLRPKITQYLAYRSGSDILVYGGPVKTQLPDFLIQSFLFSGPGGRDYLMWVPKFPGYTDVLATTPWEPLAHSTN